jgi:ParB family chromosome partitioning protein
MTTQTTSPPIDHPSAAPQLRRRLGRGLGSLISTPVHVAAPSQPTADVAPVAAEVIPMQPRSRRSPDADQHAVETHRGTPASTTVRGSERDESLQHLPIDSIQPNRRQPRQTFAEAPLAALAESIRQAGVMQPILVRPIAIEPGRSGGPLYELIAGERRWRAARLAGLTAIPAVVRAIDDRQTAEWSLIENIQREDLDPIERGHAFARLITEFAVTHQDVASRVGIDRSSVTNFLRLLELEDEIQAAVKRGELSMGHARSLLGVPRGTSRLRLASQATREGLSVRELERRVKAVAASAGAAAPTNSAPGSAGVEITGSPHLRNLEVQLSAHLGTRVRIHAGRKKWNGRLEISFYSLDEFDGLMRRIGFTPEA